MDDIAHWADHVSAVAEVIHPAKLSQKALEGAAFDDTSTVIKELEGEKILDFTSLKSSDGKFASGMYKAGPQTFDITEPYGVDEFMFFLEGSVTLISADGSATTVNERGQTIPKEWIVVGRPQATVRSGHLFLDGSDSGCCNRNWHIPSQLSIGRLRARRWSRSLALVSDATADGGLLCGGHVRSTRTLKTISKKLGQHANSAAR